LKPEFGTAEDAEDAEVGHLERLTSRMTQALPPTRNAKPFSSASSAFSASFAAGKNRCDAGISTRCQAQHWNSLRGGSMTAHEIAMTEMSESRSKLRRSVVIRLMTGAASMVLLLTAGYLGFVGTAAGQAWDNAGYAGRLNFGSEIKAYDNDLLGEVSKQNLLIAMGGLFAFSLLCRRPVVGGVAVAAAGAAVFGAEFLKQTLPRELLSAPTVPVPGYFSTDTYPSGHTTVGASLVLAMVVIAGPLLRPWLAVLAGVISSSYATAVFFMGWHRPSDALGGIAWSGICLAAGTAILVLIHGHHAPPSRHPAWKVSAALAAVVIAVLAFSAYSSHGELRLPFFVMSATIIAAGFALPAWLASVLAPIAWESSLGRKAK
jgi:hypothetical protein